MKSHNAIITRHSPTAIVFMLDLSGSMSDICEFADQRLSKNDAMNRIVNTTIHELIMRSRSYNQYNDYFDIAVLGYRQNEVLNLLESTSGTKFSSINELASGEFKTKIYDSIRTKPDGTKYAAQQQIKEYIKTHPSGATPMRFAIEECYGVLQSWVWAHKGRNCFPPIVINITDGVATDSGETELQLAASRLKRLSTENGNILLFNVHIASSLNAQATIFPDSIDKLPNIEKLQTMFEMSSYIPDSFVEPLQKFYPEIEPTSLLNAKLMCYNAPINALTKILEIGSISKSFIR